MQFARSYVQYFSPLNVFTSRPLRLYSTGKPKVPQASQPRHALNLLRRAAQEERDDREVEKYH